MTQFIKNPNLPEGEVTLLICGGMHDSVLSYFQSVGIEVLRCEQNDTIDKSVSWHCDISALYLGNGEIIVDKGQISLAETLKRCGFIVKESHNAVKGAYPSDVILNHAIIGESIIGRVKFFDGTVKDAAERYKKVDVKQGYSKCSILPVDKNSLITDDLSVYNNAVRNGFECLLIEKGDITLEGQEYGFIGGASGKISSDTVVFFGNIEKHRNFKEIYDFLSQRGVGYISFAFPLTDYGGIIPLKEKITINI